MSTEISQQTFSVHSEAETEKLAASFARALLARSIPESGMLVFLSGQLGAGKTSFVRGVLRELGFDGPVKSPTYTIVEPYLINQQAVNHFDLYRLADAEELDAMGCRDYFGNAAICFVEWPERVQNYLPDADLEIDLSLKTGSNIASRKLECTALTAAGRQLITRWIAAD